MPEEYLKFIEIPITNFVENKRELVRVYFWMQPLFRCDYTCKKLDELEKEDVIANLNFSIKDNKLDISHFSREIGLFGTLIFRSFTSSYSLEPQIQFLEKYCREFYYFVASLIRAISSLGITIVNNENCHFNITTITQNDLEKITGN